MCKSIQIHESGQSTNGRKGAIIVMVAVLLVVLLGCASLAVDIGYLYVARTELQRAADAAALAGVQALGRPSDAPIGGYFLSDSQVRTQAQSVAALNDCAGQAVSLNVNNDIIIGYLANPRDRNAAIQQLSLDQCNVVKVIARRDSSNSAGEIPLFFAPIWGENSSEVTASAVAVLDDRFYAYNGTNAMPFTLHEDIWNDEIVQGNGADNYGYDEYTGSITNSPDGVPEVKLFPDKKGYSTATSTSKGKSKGKGKTVSNISNDTSNAGAGNFGILEIGNAGNGVPALRDQIRNGISQDDFVDLTGEPMVKFYEYDSGNEVSYNISGEPGVKAGVKDAVEEKIGQVVAFFVHDKISGTGNNAVFRVVGMRFGRVMEVNLTGNVNDKAIIIQPVPQYSSGVLTSPNAPSTNKLVVSLELVR